MMQIPPRLALGSSLLFWGAMSGRPLLGLLLALVVEGRHWTRVRWEFDDAACERVWQFTVAGITLAAVLIWLDGNRYSALPMLLSWLPALLMPMQFIQSYGLGDGIPLNSLSFLAKQRRARNLRLGLPDEGTRFHFGNVLFLTCMVASTVGSQASSWMFLPGMVALSGWMLMSAARSRWALLAPVLAICGLAAMGGERALHELSEWIGRAAAQGRSGRQDPNFISTLIGTTGTIRQSPDIRWRLQPAPGKPPPRLLRTTTFNTYLGTNWQNQRLPANKNFRDLDTRVLDAEVYYLTRDDWDQESDFRTLPSFRLRGASAAESPLPLPGETTALTGFELEGVQRNPFGSVRVYPIDPVIDGTVFWRGGDQADSPPIPMEDLRVPPAERYAIDQTVTETGITQRMPLDEKLARIQIFFQEEFRYTRHLTIPRPHFRNTGTTALGRFLTDARAGHCEYFATAAALMLREAGVPARYATGYAVVERDARRSGYVIRGTHGHAWCRIWDEHQGKWLDFDPTPPDWTASVATTPTLSQRFNDSLKRLREDFFLWRNRPENRLAMSAVLLAFGIGLAVFVARRLWRSRRRIDHAAHGVATYEGEIVRTPLHALEKPARKHLGERPPGLPFAQWLSHLRHLLPDGRLLDEAISIHQQIRFDPQPPDATSADRLATLTGKIETHLTRLRHTK